MQVCPGNALLGQFADAAFNVVDDFFLAFFVGKSGWSYRV